MSGHQFPKDESVLVVDPIARGGSAAVVHDFDEIYASYFPLVLRLVRRLGVSAALVEDAVQDVFLVVYRKLDAFEGRSSIKTWLVGITFKVAKDFRRRASRKGGGEPLDESLVDPGLDPQELASLKEAAMIVDAFLEALDEDRRAIFVLADLEGWSVPEIAESLSINVNTAYSRLRLARRDFEAHLARHSGSPR